MKINVLINLTSENINLNLQNKNFTQNNGIENCIQKFNLRMITNDADKNLIAQVKFVVFDYRYLKSMGYGREMLSSYDGVYSKVIREIKGMLGDRFGNEYDSIVVIDSLTVNPHYRNQNIGGWILDNFLELIDTSVKLYNPIFVITPSPISFKAQYPIDKTRITEFLMKHRFKRLAKNSSVYYK